MIKKIQIKTNKMKIKPLQKLIPIMLLSLQIIIQTSCTKKIYDVVYPTLNDGRYDSEFPYKNASDQLEEISKSIYQNKSDLLTKKIKLLNLLLRTVSFLRTPTSFTLKSRVF